MLDKLKDLYTESIQTQISASSLLPDTIIQATQMIVDCLLRGNKIITCGNGRSYINAQLFVANLLNRYELARPSFPSVLLSLDSAINAAMALDNNTETLFQRQFNAVAQQGDILIAFSPLPHNDEIVINAINSAVNKGIIVIVLTSASNDHIQGFLTEHDLEIAIPAIKESRVIEGHCFIANAICELVDHALFSHS
ncbi:SIS domain-containing protein [Pasteurella multocida subsp. multocida]|uniref:SIS domain-containing protein n=1 Tax=Pasteurella multocida TaxID=747 RepID=A0A9X3UR67_PASMD|nr:SIS domain-containing protein [Pasteurella multocida]MBF6981282.1 SIS domain-containing protein [Pasteurella multocida]MBF6985880.1 SIS domain-containing protein [Pasteurella multocida]MDA5608835.1 SIS domain-containing protein [Pasteurella multocida subsp. multocida]MDA5611271.1 SIS domain-containing protein [Pasteurella multocida]MDA5613772.1 SIS domain-containing protein [Pasteurella multocida]